MSSLLRLERKQKIYSNAFRICIFLFSRSYSFGIETINTFIHSRSSIENYTRFQTIMGKSIPVFRPKRPQIHTLCGGTNLHGLFWGVQPPPPPHLPRASQKGTNEVQSNLALRAPALYRHIIITDSLFCPWGKKAPTFSLNLTRLTRTLSMSPSVSVLTRFDCIIHFKLCSAAGFVLYCSVRFVSTTDNWYSK